MQEADPSKSPALRTLVNSIGMKFVLIPAGSFDMGSLSSEKGSTAPERPQHRVKISKSFYLGVHEVTQSGYESVTGKNPSYYKALNAEDAKRLPVESVSWLDAFAFVNKLSTIAEEVAFGREYRLPTEAQWEYACRGGTTSAFSFGDACSSAEANFDGEHPYGGAPKGMSLRRAAPVGSYKPNAFGLYDMHGNLFEWCADWYDKEAYKTAPLSDPQGPEQGQHRVLRGGSWNSISLFCRSADRYYDKPFRLYPDYGFRVAFVSPETEQADGPAR